MRNSVINLAANCFGGVLMRITNVKVSKLFGVFNHTIDLNIDDRITIIHAPNGFGKTTILRMLNGIFSGRFSELELIPFIQFEVSFDDTTRLVIRKHTGAESSPHQSELHIS